MRDWAAVYEGSALVKCCWVMDGNFGDSTDIRFSAADTIIFLHRSRFVCLARWFKRFVKYRKGGRPDMAEGCSENIDFDYLCWIWNFPVRSRPKLLERVKKYGAQARLITLRSDKDVGDFFAAL